MTNVPYYVLDRKKSLFTPPCSLPIKWPDVEVDILDIHISKNNNELITINFNRKLAKIDKILQPSIVNTCLFMTQ